MIIYQIYIFSVGNNQITSKGALILFETLKSCKSLEYIYIGWNPIDDHCIDGLIELFSCCPNIKNVDLSGKYSWIFGSSGRIRSPCGKLSNVGISKLFSSFVGNIELRLIDISNHKGVTNNLATHISKIIKSSCIEDIFADERSISFHYPLFSPLIENKFKNGNLKKICHPEKFVFIIFL